MFKRISLLLVLLASYISLLSQVFTIPADGAEWNNTVISIGTDHLITTRVETEGDTLIGSVLYTKLFKTWKVNYYQEGAGCKYHITSGPSNINYYEGAIRTNEMGEVQFIWEYDTIVRTIYNFSLLEGDSVQIDGIDVKYYAFVQNVDTISINDQERKRITLVGIHGLTDVWIEGIGSIYGLFATFDRHWEAVDYELTCYEENGVTMYDVHPECTRCDIATKTSIHRVDAKLSVFPNPIYDRSVIEWSYSFQPEQMNVFDLLGRKLYSKSINGASNTYIDRTNLEKGVLLLEVLDNEGETYKQLIIVK